MSLEERLKSYAVDERDDDFHVKIEFDRLDHSFTKESRLLTLYSKVSYTNEDFNWSAIIPTVEIPYKDPAVGFYVNGKVFSSLGVYQRAPGVALSSESRTVTKDNIQSIVTEPRVDIVTAKNTMIYMSYKRNCVQIIFKKSGQEHKVPVGVFLKAITGLPYKVILDKIAFKPQMLWNSFPQEIRGANEDMSKCPHWENEGDPEPSTSECVDRVYNAITGNMRGNMGLTSYSVHWKMNKIRNYLNSMHFKTVQNFEAKLSLGNRAIGTCLDQDVKIPVFKGNSVDTGDEVEYFELHRGDFVSDDDAREIRRHDISTLRVRNERSFVLQEDSPVYFRAKGYRIAQDVVELHDYVAEHGLEQLGVDPSKRYSTVGLFIDEELLAKLNELNLSYLEVFTPEGRKTLRRTVDTVDASDFYTILNFLFTEPLKKRDDVTQYEVGNRVIRDYEQQVFMEVESVYEKITDSIIGTVTPKELMESLASNALPSKSLADSLSSAGKIDTVQSDLTNIMSRAIVESTASAGLREAPAAMMLVQKGQYGRLDSLHSPDSDKVGSVQHLTVFAKINGETGDITTPYERVSEGKPTGEIEYISASKENNKYIAAWDETFEEPTVRARYNGDVTTVARERVDYKDVSPFCDMSISRMCIPFPGFSQPKRAIMATKMNGQAIPVLNPERPLVSTGADTEVPALYYTARQIIESQGLQEVPGAKLEILDTMWGKVLVTYTMLYGNNSFKFSLPFTVTDQRSLYCYNVNLNTAEPKSYNLDDIVFYSQSCDTRDFGDNYWERVKQGKLPLFKDCTAPAMALGVNLRMCYKTYGTSTIDDAVLISDRLIADKTLSSVQIFRYEYELKDKESFVQDGIIGLHAHVATGQPVITVNRAKGAKFIERSVTAKQAGEVVYCDVDVNHGHAEVWVSTIHNAVIGDKVAGRYGNKSVIARVVPEYMMPYDPDDGIAMDIVCSPLGLPSRMNFGQVLEVALGAAMAKNGTHAVVTPFYPNIKGEVQGVYKDAGLQPKRLFNPVYGKLTERPVMTGVLYFMKLEQMSNLKESSLGYPVAMDAVFSQPVKSMNKDKGQAIGEYESWALNAAGANRCVNAFFSYYSDDEESRRRYFEMLEGNEDSKPGLWEEYEGGDSGGVKEYREENKNALVTQTVIRMFGLDIDSSGNHYRLLPLRLDDIVIETTKDDIRNNRESLLATSENTWTKCKLSKSIVNPFWIEYFPLSPVLGVESIKAIASGKHYLNPSSVGDGRIPVTMPKSKLTEEQQSSWLCGMEAVVLLLRNTTIDQAIKFMGDKYGTGETAWVTSEYFNANDDDEEVEHDVDEDEAKFFESREIPITNMNIAKVINFLNQMRGAGMELSDLIWDYLPIIPKLFRQAATTNGKEHAHPFQTQTLAILKYNQSDEIYNCLKQFIGYGKTKEEDHQTIRGYFFGKGSKAGEHGKVRSAVLSRRVGFSGRTVITPAQDIHMSPFFIGLPWKTVLTEMSRIIAIRLFKRSGQLSNLFERERNIPLKMVQDMTLEQWEAIVESLYEYNPYILKKYFRFDEVPNLNYSSFDEHGNVVTDTVEDKYAYIYNRLRSVVKEIVEGVVTDDGKVLYNGEFVDPRDLSEEATIDASIAIVGRQPTLHKKSIRSYFVKLVDGNCTQIHPIVCKGYNADFDGDTMWNVQLLGSLKVEACKTISVLQDLISEKDGSFTLELSQDTALGIYCATSFKDNAHEFTGSLGQYVYFDSIEELKVQLEYGDLKYYDAVLYRSPEGNLYCSTAGRILVNAAEG